MSSLRYFTGDGLPPQIQSFVTSQDVDNETTALHINDGSIHRVMDDFAVSYDTLWSSRKTQDEIATGGADQQLNTFDAPTFLGLNLTSDYNASLLFRRGGGGPKWTIQNTASQADRLVIRDGGSQVVLSVFQDGQIAFGNSTLDEAYVFPVVRATAAGSQLVDLEGNGFLSWHDRAFHQSGILQNTVLTLLNVAEWTSITGPRIVGFSSNFANVGRETRYDGVATRMFKIDVNVALDSTKNSQLLSIGVFKNGVLSELSEQRCVIEGPQNCATSTILELGTGDFVEIRIRNMTDSKPAFVYWLNQHITEIQ